MEPIPQRTPTAERGVLGETEDSVEMVSLLASRRCVAVLREGAHNHTKEELLTHQNVDTVVDLDLAKHRRRNTSCLGNLKQFA